MINNFKVPQGDVEVPHRCQYERENGYHGQKSHWLVNGVIQGVIKYDITRYILQVDFSLSIEGIYIDTE